MQAVHAKPDGHPDIRHGRIGVLLVNLGTPEATDYWSMRRYLKEFLSDRRVIETSRLIWWPVLNGIILTFRPGRKGKEYDAIWNKERDEGPLKTFTRAQAEKLAAKMGGTASLDIDWAMRYGKPSIAEKLGDLLARGCDRILLVPLYPQYAAATSATVCDKAFDALKQMRWQPALRVAPPWHDEPAYIDGLANSLRQHMAALSFTPDAVLASFHGIPQDYFDKGDPYYCHCAKTTRLLRAAMGMSSDQLKMTFQSRFGPAEWIKPYTDVALKELAAAGKKNVVVITPGFTSDCLETIEEIGVENRDNFLNAGGQNYSFVPCLNDSDDGMHVIETVVRRELSGWL